jgi:large subunit ribosomal protein L22
MTMEVRASAKFMRVSPRKARLVTDLITGRPAEEALAILQNMAKGSAPLLAKVLRSAVANAENNYNMTMEDLYVKRATANEGPRMKRVWMRGRGRRDQKLHRTSHLTIVVDSKEGA